MGTSAEATRAAGGGGPRRTGRRTVLAVCVASAAWVGFAVAPTSSGADPAIAGVLLEAGKKDVQKKLYTEALAKLVKALREDPEQVEAHYWIGFAEEKRGDESAALAAYRQFRDACAARASAGGSASRELAALLKKASARLAVLAAGETELSKLNDGFIARALAYAKANFLREPLLAEKAARGILAVKPDHEEASKLLEKLGAESPATVPAGGNPLYRGVKEWKDFVKLHALGSNPGWTYENDQLTVDHKGGQFITPPDSLATGKSFVYEIEARMTEPYPPSPGIGLVFASAPGRRGVVVHFDRDELVLWDVGPDDKPRDHKKALLEALDLKEWHRLTVLVTGRHVEAHFDGKKLIDQDVPGREELDGQPGIFHQDSRAEIRVLRLGTRR